MVNQYGQTDLTQALLAQGTSPSPYKTGLGQAARLGGIALAEWGKRKKAEQSRSALADALAGLNRGSLTGEGPTTDAAGRAPIGDPQLLARLLSDPNTAGVGQALLGRALQPAPKPDIRQAADGFLYNMRTGKRALPEVAKQTDPYNLSPGQQRFDGNGNLIASVPPKPREPSARDAAFASLSLSEQQDILRKAGQTNITLPSNAQETEEAKKFGGLLVSRYENVLNEADAAQAQLSVIQQARALNESALPSQLQLTAGNVMQSIGINPESVPGFEFVSNGQQFNAVMEQAVLSAMQAQKGPQTDADQRRIKSTVANLSNTAEAREFLLDSAEAMNTMKTMKAEFWRNYRAEKGTLAGAEKAWSDTFGRAGLVRRWEEDGVSGIFFFPEWYAAARGHPDNAGLSDAQILELWKSYD